MSRVVMVCVNVGNADEAVKIARTLVEEELVACGNIIPGIRSIYRWKGEIFDEEEVMLIMKTQASLFPTVQSRVQSLHSYEVPEIIALDISDGLPEYLAWVMENTRFERHP